MQNPINETILHNLVVLGSLNHRPDEEVEGYLKELEVLNPSNVLVNTVKNMGDRVEQLEKEFMQIIGDLHICFETRLFFRGKQQIIVIHRKSPYQHLHNMGLYLLA